MGNIEYNIYLKNDKGDLTLLDHTGATKYETTVDTSGNYTYVVKTTYSIFKANMSDGKSVSATVNIKTPIVPEPTDDKDNSNSSNNSDKENSSSSDTNNTNTENTQQP